MTNFAVVAGHNEHVPGASGHGFQEHEVARKLKNRVIHFLKEVGETAFDATDDVGREKTKVWMNAATNCNKLIGKNGYVIAIHLNSNYGEPATGTEVFDWKGTQKAKCQAVATRLAKDFSWKIRGDKGWKDGSWIGLIKKTLAPVIYIEVCFINNISDITKLTRNIDMAAVGIVEAMTNKKVKKETVLVNEPKSDYKETKYEPLVDKARLANIMFGYDEHTFGIEDSLKRGEFLIVMDRLGLLDKK